MPTEFWFTIGFSFIGGTLSFLVHLTKKEKTGAIFAIIISFLIAIISFILGIKNWNLSQNPEMLGNQIFSTSSIQNTASNTNSQTENTNVLFTNYFETHTPAKISSYIGTWKSNSDKDIRGSYHEYENGLKLSIFKGFNLDTNIVTSDLHLVLNKKYQGNTNFTGSFILHDRCSGTKSNAEFSILIDGKEIWKSPTKLTGTTVTPIEFHVDLKNAKEEVIIRTTCYLQDDEMHIGIF